MNPHRRRIAVGIGDHGALAVLDWVVALAHPGDLIQIVQAYQPLPGPAAGWHPPAEDEHFRYAATCRHAAFAAKLLRRKRPDVTVTAWTVRYPSSQALLAVIDAADLVVACSAYLEDTGPAWHQLIQHLRCPVLRVDRTPGPPGQAPIAVLLRELSRDGPTIEAALELAVDLHSRLIAVRPWQPHRATGLGRTEAEEELALASFLSPWRRRHPEVEIAGRLQLGDARSALRRCAAEAAVLVLGDDPDAGSPIGAPDPVLAEAIRAGTAPTLLVPRRPDGGRLRHHAEWPATSPARLDRHA